MGAVTAQASSPPTITTSVLESLKRGAIARDALDAALAENEAEFREWFQVAVVDTSGRTAAFTGQRPQDWRGHATGDGWVAAGNILTGAHVAHALGEAFEANHSLHLAERLLVSLEAGVAAGGDRRGHRGALLKLSTGSYLSNLDIRIHEHPTPVVELRRLLNAFRSETDVEQVAMRAITGVITGVRPHVVQSRLDELAGCTVRDGVERLRGMLIEDCAPVQAVGALDDLLSALADKPDISELQFGHAWQLLSHVQSQEK